MDCFFFHSFWFCPSEVGPNCMESGRSAQQTRVQTKDGLSAIGGFFLWLAKTPICLFQMLSVFGNQPPWVYICLVVKKR